MVNFDAQKVGNPADSRVETAYWVNIIGHCTTKNS